MDALVFSQTLVGRGGQTAITTANVAQPLVTSQRMAKAVQVFPDPSNTGTLLISYGDGLEPLLPQLTLNAGEGKMFDLAKITIKSTVAGDNANWNAIVSY